MIAANGRWLAFPFGKNCGSKQILLAEEVDFNGILQL